MIFRKFAVLATAAVALSAASAAAFADEDRFSNEPYWKQSATQSQSFAPAAMERITKTNYDQVDRYNP
jgi:hypothetical protein